MNIKLISVLLALCLLTGLLAGCGGIGPARPTSAPQTETAQTANDTEATETEAAVTEIPATDTPATEPPATEAPEQTEPDMTDAVFERLPDESCDRYSNQIVEIVFRENDGSVVCREIETGAERTLFTVTPNKEITISLIGVTNQRLYFGWNELEDWWGVDVYSVDYQGKDRKEHGQFWDPTFENGWLLLLGFRSDVSPTEMLLIDRDDRVAAENENGAVWDAVVVDGAVYYLYVEDVPASWDLVERDGGWNYDLIRVEPNSDVTVVKVFEGQPTFFSPAFFRDGVICFYDTNEFYDLFTLEPTAQPTYD